MVADGQNLIHGYAFEVANERSIARKRAILDDFLKREAKALDWAAAHPDAYAKVLAKETGLPFDIALTMVRKNSRRMVPITSSVVQDQNIVLDTLRQAGEIKMSRSSDEAFL